MVHVGAEHERLARQRGVAPPQDAEHVARGELALPRGDPHGRRDAGQLAWRRGRGARDVESGRRQQLVGDGDRDADERRIGRRQALEWPEEARLHRRIWGRREHRRICLDRQQRRCAELGRRFEPRAPALLRIVRRPALHQLAGRPGLALRQPAQHQNDPAAHVEALVVVAPGSLVADAETREDDGSGQRLRGPRREAAVHTRTEDPAGRALALAARDLDLAGDLRQGPQWHGLEVARRRIRPPLLAERLDARRGERGRHVLGGRLEPRSAQPPPLERRRRQEADVRAERPRPDRLEPGRHRRCPRRRGASGDEIVARRSRRPLPCVRRRRNQEGEARHQGAGTQEGAELGEGTHGISLKPRSPRGRVQEREKAP